MSVPIKVFLAFWAIGFIGGVGNEYNSNRSIDLLTRQNNAILETITYLFSIGGLIDFVVLPALSAAYIGGVVWIYMNWILKKFQKLPKAFLIIATLILGIIGMMVFLLIVGLVFAQIS